MIITGGQLSAKSGLTLLARILGNNGEPITRASLSAIAYTVKDRTNDAAVSTDSLTISTVVFDDLQQNDPRWTKDNENAPGPDGRWGYNFLATLPASAFPGLDDDDAEDTTEPLYQIDVKFTPASGEVFYQIWQFRPARVYG